MRLGGVVLGGLVGDHAHKTLFEAGNEGARAETQTVGGLVFHIGAALKFLAVHGAAIVDISGIAQLEGLIVDLGVPVDRFSFLENKIVEVGLHLLVGDKQGLGELQLHGSVDRLVQRHVGANLGLKIVVTGHLGHFFLGFRGGFGRGRSSRGNLGTRIGFGRGLLIRGRRRTAGSEDAKAQKRARQNIQKLVCFHIHTPIS